MLIRLLEVDVYDEEESEEEEGKDHRDSCLFKHTVDVRARGCNPKIRSPETNL